MHGRVCQSIAPVILSAVEISPRIDSDVVTVNPQVHVELVSVGGAGGEVCAADEGAGVGGAEEVDTAVRK